MRKSVMGWALAGLLANGMAGAASLELLKDIGDNDVLASSSPSFLGAVGNRGYFAATPFGGMPRLYRTDGTSATTVPVATPVTINRPREGREIAGRLVFFANGNSDRAKEMWATDGTDGGTVRLAEATDSSAYFVWLGTRRESRGYFHQTSGLSTPLMVTDGTAAGTRNLTPGRNVGGSIPQPFDNAGNFYFWSSLPGSLDPELWVSDGTIAGTHALIDHADISLTILSRLMYVSGGSALVSGEDDLGRGVFSLDLATGVATRLSNLTHLVRGEGIHVGSLHYFVMGNDLWRSDGTPAGTFSLAPGDSGFDVSETLMVVGGRVLFGYRNDTDGQEIWSTDGTLAGTMMLRESKPGSGGTAILLATAGAHAYYLAGDEQGSTPVQLWVTDGTPAGTKPIPLGGSTSYSLQVTGYEHTVIAEDRVYFVTGHLPDTFSPMQMRLFAADPAGNAAVDLGNGGRDAIAVGGSLLFTNAVDPSGLEPWFSDGTPGGTGRLLDIATSGQTNSADPKDFTPLGDRALFVADDGDSGRELWVTDGSSAGTLRVRDLAPGAASSNPSGLRNVGGLVYFVAGNGGVSDGGGGRLWRSDGTEAGTFNLGNTRAAAGGGASGGCANWATFYNGRVWFFGQSEIWVGTELWSTDGTEAGTRREFLLPAETRSAAHCELHTTANGLIFIQDTAPDTQLWLSDGTLEGTTRIPNLRPAGVNSGAASMSAPITVVNGIAYLLADGGDGLEPWRSNGTVAGTAQVENLTAGALGAQVYAATPFGDGIVFMYVSEPGDADGLWRIVSPTSGADRIKSGSIARPPVNAGSRVFFEFNDAGGTESLWVTDGTALGTRSVFSASTGSSLSIADRLGGDGTFYFTGSIAGGGAQLYVTSGAAGSPRSLASLPGLSVFPSRAVLLQGRPLLAFDEAGLGTEPYILRGATPVAVADTAVVSSGASVLVNVRANDVDVDSAAADLVVTIVTPPSNGTAVLESGSVRYTPAGGFTGSDTFQYRLTDELGLQSAVVTAAVTVNAAPQGGGACCGSDEGGGSGGGGSVDLLMLALLTAASYRRSRKVFARR